MEPEAPLDSWSMLEATAGLAEQIEVAVEVASGADLSGLPSRDQIENVLVLGMGGSGVSGDLLTVAAGPFLPVPVVVVKGYEPPSYANENTLVFAMSFSGDTEETVDAATTAALAGAPVVAVTRGGEIGRLARSWHSPVIAVADGIPAPRAGLGALAVPPLVVLERLGLFPGAIEWIHRGVEQLKRRRDALMVRGNEAEVLARRIGRTIPLVYGGGGIGHVAATRWKTQINENAKAPAFANTVPELCHNEIAGWGQHGDLTRQVFSLVQLRHEHEHPQVMKRFELVTRWTEEVMGGVHDVRAEGDGALAQLLDLISFGDFVSLHLAFQEGVDPGPVPVLDEIKAALQA
jgi:glucose/mannose-6-phosphate isomerase